MKHVLYLVQALAVSMLGSAIAEEPGELTKLKADFRREMAESGAPLLDLDVKYLSHLEKQKKAYQDMGNLEGILAIDAEIKGFEAGKVGDSSFAEVKRLQGIYRSQRKKLLMQRAANAQPVILAYKEKAEELASTFTKSNQLDDALLAKAESERLAALAKSSKPLVPVSAPPPDSAKSTFSVGRRAGEEMENGIEMELCWIPPGTFTMGTPEDEGGRYSQYEAQVEVTLTKGFWMGKHEVTQGEYEEVMGSNPSHFKDVGKNAPVEQVSWKMAMEFCGKLTEREQQNDNLPEGWTYTLPTEAQWEYACRAGSEERFSEGDSEADLSAVGWWQRNGGDTTHEVGEKDDNRWGLHDMHGNVFERVFDRWVSNLPGGNDPGKPAEMSQHPIRGGAFCEPAFHCRSGTRIGSVVGKSARIRPESVGFRAALVPAE